MNGQLRSRIADAFRQEESMYQVPPELREEILGAVVDRRPGGQAAPRLLAVAALLLAAVTVVTLIGLRRLAGAPAPAVTPHQVVSPVPSASPSPTAQFTVARLASAAPGRPLNGIAVVFTETGLDPNQTVTYRITGDVDLVYDCGSGGPGGPAYPVRGSVDVTVTRTADAQGEVTSTIAIPPAVAVPACSPPTRQYVITGNYTNFVVSDETSGVAKSAGGTNVAI
jgi:hypothetical protein